MQRVAWPLSTDASAKMEVSVLVTQMHDTLSTIHRTLDSLNNTNHDEKLDELEQKREDNIQALFEAFTVESESLSQKRKAERDDIAERRRIEDEERERRRRLEDEDLAVRDTALDEEREERLKEDAIDIEEEVDGLMAQVEEEAQRTIEEGRERLRALEEKRKVRQSPEDICRVLTHFAGIEPPH